jgi:hypothetical protein
MEEAFIKSMKTWDKILQINEKKRWKQWINEQRIGKKKKIWQMEEASIQSIKTSDKILHILVQMDGPDPLPSLQCTAAAKLS